MTMSIKKVFVSFLVFMLVTVTVAYAVNKILVVPGAPLLFADAAQVEDVTLTMSAIAAGAGQCSNQYTKTGANLKSQNWEMRPHFQLTGTNVVGEVVEFYIATSDGSNVQGNITGSNGALATDKRKNLTFAGVVVVDQTTTNTTMAGAFPVRIEEGLFQVCFWNATTLPLRTDTSVHGIRMKPMDIEVQ
jgi:hypothetical protein